MTLCPHCKRPMLRAGLTKRQQDCLNAIWAYIDKYGVAPSYEEIATAISMKSKSSVSRVLHGLEDRGWVDLTPHIGRSLVPLERVA